MKVQTNILSGGGDCNIPLSHISGSSMEVCMYFHLRYNKIGLKHDFLCINIWWAPKVALKPESVKKRVFRAPRGILDVYVAVKHVLLLLSEYCIEKCLLENLG